MAAWFLHQVWSHADLFMLILRLMGRISYHFCVSSALSKLEPLRMPSSFCTDPQAGFHKEFFEKGGKTILRPLPTRKQCPLPMFRHAARIHEQMHTFLLQQLSLFLLFMLKNHLFIINTCADLKGALSLPLYESLPKKGRPGMNLAFFPYNQWRIQGLEREGSCSSNHAPF